MPIYEYICPEGHLFEDIEDAPRKTKKCPECGKRAKHRLSVPAIRFHGSGFYSTDYKKKQGKKG